jgi:hypothetical protein
MQDCLKHPEEVVHTALRHIRSLERLLGHAAWLQAVAFERKAAREAHGLAPRKSFHSRVARQARTLKLCTVGLQDMLDMPVLFAKL